MNQKEILIVIIAGIISFLISFFLFYSPSTDKENNNNNQKLSIVTYTLNYGTYKGYETEYNPDTKKAKKKEIKIELTKDNLKINNEMKNYTIENDTIYIDKNPIYKITGNNKFILLAGSGVEFKYEK